MDLVHFRMVVPPELTRPAVDLLSPHELVLNLVVLRAAGASGADAIECDVVKGAANTLLDGLRGLGVDRAGSIAVDGVDLMFSHRAEEIEAGRPSVLVHSPLWASVEAHIREEGTYPPSFYLFLVIAGLIGSVGIMTNSQILIVAAMVVGPEYHAITSIALGLDRRDRRRIQDGTRALTAGFLLAITVTLAFAAVSRAIGLQSRAFDAGLRPVSHLIDTPDAFSLTVAVLAGIVGIVSLTEARASTLLGVFISVTTIPAASDVAVSLAFADWGEARGSLVQLLANVVVLVVVGVLTLRLQRRLWHRAARRADGRTRR
ncbi:MULTISPECIES: DUF389 domain-containing protein [unclassified Streptomyces]|uniref:DUF389 domain-containing protein n=1 Tax=unclassified Streptomyces TaxID=2593676 RepID=UPI001F036AEC|nr:MULTISPECIES: DUF389 domain-containing protein [unclassified Streptomyces]MCH0563920.1 DUF389 domain-containing protein [Streptomyces sp. MUM 2J]MCH0570687.1 DUF389 domain-containing protein [Streptomyces sp. MUM 136J]